MAILFTSDLHLGHKNILSNRPEFSDIDEMNEYLIKKWNDKVNETDEVYIIGDFSFRSEYGANHYLDRMKGIKHLVVGNHDHRWMKNIDL